jgi:hypothetical protein
VHTKCANARNADLRPWSTPLSYRLYYRAAVAQRHKRSISLPPELDQAVEHAAVAAGTSVSAWLAETAAHRLLLEAGRKGIAAWEKDNGPLTADELAEGLERARRLLGRSRRAPAGKPA